MEMNNEDSEALIYKADTILELEEPEWALNLCDKALTLNPDYTYAHYQRACANATLGQLEIEQDDLKYAIDLSATYLDEARNG